MALKVISASVPENTTFVTILADAIVDAVYGPIFYSVDQGPDVQLFKTGGAPWIDSLSFIAAPDFEHPSDSNHDNVYDVTVHSADGYTAYSVFTEVIVTVTNVNEPPVNTVPGQQGVSPGGNVPIGGLSIADEDANSGILTTILSVGHGKLALDPFGASVSGSMTNVVTLTGTLSEINTTLGAPSNVHYQADSGFAGFDTLTMTTNDNGNSGSGGALSDTDHVLIHPTMVGRAQVFTEPEGFFHF